MALRRYSNLRKYKTIFKSYSCCLGSSLQYRRSIALPLSFFVGKCQVGWLPSVEKVDCISPFLFCGKVLSWVAPFSTEGRLLVPFPFLWESPKLGGSLQYRRLIASPLSFFVGKIVAPESSPLYRGLIANSIFFC